MLDTFADHSFTLLLKSGAYDEALDLLDAEDGVDGLAKAAGHKYIRRIPISGAGKKKYRYIYSAAHAVASFHGDNTGPQVGEKLRVADGEHQGHYEITGTHDDGHVTVKHDESGKEMKIHAGKLREMVESAHGEAAKKEKEKARQAYAIMAMHGSEKQRDRALATLKRRDPDWAEHKSKADGAAYERSAGAKIATQGPGKAFGTGAAHSQAAANAAQAGADKETVAAHHDDAARAYDTHGDHANALVAEAAAIKLRTKGRMSDKKALAQAHAARVAAGKPVPGGPAGEKEVKGKVAAGKTKVKLSDAQASALEVHALDVAHDEPEAQLVRDAFKDGHLHIDPEHADKIADFLNERSNAADGSPDPEDKKNAKSLASLMTKVRAAGKPTFKPVEVKSEKKGEWHVPTPALDSTGKLKGGERDIMANSDFGEAVSAHYNWRLKVQTARNEHAKKLTAELKGLLGKEADGKFKGFVGQADFSASSSFWDRAHRDSEDIRKVSAVLRDPKQLKEHGIDPKGAAALADKYDAHAATIDAHAKAFDDNVSKFSAEERKKGEKVPEKGTLSSQDLSRLHERMRNMNDGGQYGDAAEISQQIADHHRAEGDTERAGRMDRNTERLKKDHADQQARNQRDADFKAKIKEQAPKYNAAKKDADEASKKAATSGSGADHDAAQRAHMTAGQQAKDIGYLDDHAAHMISANKHGLAAHEAKLKEKAVVASPTKPSKAPKDKAIPGIPKDHNATKKINDLVREHVKGNIGRQASETLASMMIAREHPNKYNLGDDSRDGAPRPNSAARAVAGALYDHHAGTAPKKPTKAKESKPAFVPVATSKKKDDHDAFDHSRPSAEHEFEGPDHTAPADVDDPPNLKVKHPANPTSIDEFKDWNDVHHDKAADHFDSGGVGSDNKGHEAYFNHLADMHDALREAKQARERSQRPAKGKSEEWDRAADKQKAEDREEAAQHSLDQANRIHEGLKHEAAGTVKGRNDFPDAEDLSGVDRGTTFTTEEGHVFRHEGGGRLKLMHDAHEGIVNAGPRSRVRANASEINHVDDLPESLRIREPKDTRTLDMFAAKSSYDGVTMSATKEAAADLRKGFGHKYLSKKPAPGGGWIYEYAGQQHPSEAAAHLAAAGDHKIDADERHARLTSAINAAKPDDVKHAGAMVQTPKYDPDRRKNAMAHAVVAAAHMKAGNKAGAEEAHKAGRAAVDERKTDRDWEHGDHLDPLFDYHNDKLKQLGSSAHDKTNNWSSKEHKIGEGGEARSTPFIDHSHEGDEPDASAEKSERDDNDLRKAQPTAGAAVVLSDRLDRVGVTPAAAGVYDALGSASIQGDEGRPRFIGKKPTDDVVVGDSRPLLLKRPKPGVDTVAKAEAAVASSLREAYRAVLTRLDDEDPTTAALSKSTFPGERRTLLTPRKTQPLPERNDVVAVAAGILKAAAAKDEALADGLSRLRVSPRTLGDAFDALRLTPTQVLAGF